MWKLYLSHSGAQGVCQKLPSFNWGLISITEPRSESKTQYASTGCPVTPVTAIRELRHQLAAQKLTQSARLEEGAWGPVLRHLARLEKKQSLHKRANRSAIQ